ncbi:Tetraspanin-5 [Collichthys lucidus]|uniref:Tetraspanin-5 n=1 Tax=Collichthys lucidus TaxID=240159 RepID=A0A4U5U370_COLLU|nr:Tetraspanin-5 [Collichthys lucidus]
MFILGFAGCIGALRENSFLLKFFSVFLGIIFFLELTAGVLAFVFKDWIKDQLNSFINNNIRAYRDDIDLQNLIDFTQEYWECCGAFGADDWNLNIYFNCTDSNPSREKCGVPFSCCTKDPAEDVINTQCGYDIRAKPDSEQRTFIYIKGCVPQFEKWLQDNLTVVAGIFIGIALLQVRNNVNSSVCHLSTLNFLPNVKYVLCFFVFLDFWHLFSTESRERHRSCERELFVYLRPPLQSPKGRTDVPELCSLDASDERREIDESANVSRTKSWIHM